MASNVVDESQVREKLAHLRAEDEPYIHLESSGLGNQIRVFHASVNFGSTSHAWFKERPDEWAVVAMPFQNIDPLTNAVTMVTRAQFRHTRFVRTQAPD